MKNAVVSCYGKIMPILCILYDYNMTKQTWREFNYQTYYLFSHKKMVKYTTF